MVLAIDHSFLHLLRNAEGKDGNPLNEMRMLCNVIMENDGVMIPDKSIKYDAEVADEAGFWRSGQVGRGGVWAAGRGVL